LSPSFGEPAAEAVERWLECRRGEPVSVPPGLAVDGEPAGWRVDEASIELGRGDGAFGRAREALRAWRQFPAGWTRIRPAAAPIEVGTTVVVLARVVGLWWLNAARIVETVDEADRFGFVYATLEAHAERGLERFQVERSGDAVRYRLRAVSRPRHPLARIGYPVTRLHQRRFRRDSLAGMRRATVET
jgi:uncharacterized protein (UPF0548 family)